MANGFLSNGLLGMGGMSSGQSSGMSSLLGDLYDPKEARKAQMKQMLLGMGMGLMSERGFGRGAELALAMGSRAGEDYRQSALDAYRLQQADEEREYRRQQDEENDAYRQQQWDYNVGRQNRADAWQNTQMDWQMQDRQQQEDMRADQQNQVEDWMGDFEAQGGNLFSPEMQMGLRQQGIQGVDPRDTQKYERMQPLAGAGMYPQAFEQMMAEPAAGEQFTLGEGQVRYDQYGNPIAAGPPKQSGQPSDLQILQQINTERQAAGQPPMSTEEYLARKKGGGIKISPDGTIQIGGASGGTEGDRRAASLYQQIAEQEPQIMAGFDALGQPQNYAGANVPGGSAIMTPEAQVAADAITNVVANWLYLTSGATATDAEIERQTAMVTPGPFDSAQRKNAKKARLKQIIQTMKDRAGAQQPPALELSVEDLLQQYGGE